MIMVRAFNFFNYRGPKRGLKVGGKFLFTTLNDQIIIYNLEV
jgi:hypothetical protein